MKLRSLLIAAVYVLLSGTALAANPIDAKADGGGIYIAATLAPVNSFEWQAAPSYTRLAVVRRQSTATFRKGAITLDQFQAVLEKTDHVRSLLDRAVAACAQDDLTGKCLKSAKTANRLLASANTELARLK